MRRRKWYNTRDQYSQWRWWWRWSSKSNKSWKKQNSGSSSNNSLWWLYSWYFISPIKKFIGIGKHLWRCSALSVLQWRSYSYQYIGIAFKCNKRYRVWWWWYYTFFYCKGNIKTAAFLLGSVSALFFYFIRFFLFYRINQ